MSYSSGEKDKNNSSVEIDNLNLRNSTIASEDGVKEEERKITFGLLL